MSAFKGTPGPWQTDCDQHDAPYQDIRVQAGGHRICIVRIDDAPVPEYNATQEANARLIAAAPELLDALIRANELLRLVACISPADTPHAGSIGAAAEAAIAKATGEQA